MRLIRKQNSSRIWELDFLRGIALFIMVYFHVIFDLADIYGLNINYTQGFIFYIGKVAVIIFIFVSGISSTFSHNNIKRGIKVFYIAMIITVITHFAGNNLGIKFGILHFLGICMILYPLIAKLKNRYLFTAGVVIILVGNYLSSIIAPNDYLFIFNLTSKNFISSDYYPLLPWMGIYLFGIAIGRYVYPEKSSVFKFSMKENLILKSGRNTLLIYIIHQPVILLILAIIFRIKI